MILLPGRVSLDPDTLLQAYSRGIFPMHVETRLRWVTNDPRAILPLDHGFRIPRRLATSLRRSREAGRFRVTRNQAFEAVMRSCAVRPVDETWITEPLIQAYTRIHQLGHAHSVEVWDQGEMVGGLYGVSLGAAFFGESIFHTVSDAGKVALVHLVSHLRQQGFQLLDIQMVTDLTESFGACEIPLRDYLRRLSPVLGVSVAFTSLSDSGSAMGDGSGSGGGAMGSSETGTPSSR